MTAETDRIIAESEDVTLSSGSVVLLERLRTRQFFSLLRILTHGGSAMFNLVDMAGDMTEDDFTNKLIFVVLMAIPDAPQETVDFLRTMVKPKTLDTPKEVGSIVVPDGGYETNSKGEPTDKPVLTDVQRLSQELANPELDDTLELVEAIVRREAPDLKALGRRVRQMWDLAMKTGQVKTEPKETKKTKTLSAVSQEPST